MRLFILLLISLPLLSSAQDRKFSPDQLKEDLRILKEGIEEFDPALGLYQDKEEFLAIYDSISASISSEMTDLEFYPYLVRLGAATNEAHTMIDSYSDTVTNIFKGFYNGEFRYFPVSLRYDEQGAVRLWGNLSPNPEIEQGDKLTSINGRPIEDVLKELRNYQITDGIQSVAEVRAIELFSSQYFWHIDKPDTFELGIERDGELLDLSIPAISRDSMIYWRNKRYPNPNAKEPSIDDVYEFEIEDNHALLTLKTFNRQIKEKYNIKTKDLYSDIFSQLNEKGIRHLVLDIRGNAGGRSEYADDLLPYIMKEERKGTRYLATSWKGKVITYKYPKQNKRAFDGTMYVLTDAFSFSNGSVIPMMVKEYGNGVIIGSETASRYGGFAAGSRQTVTLPNTGLRCYIPRYVYTYPDGLSGQDDIMRGVVPDYPVTYTWQQRMDKLDPVMDKALELIRQSSLTSQTTNRIDK